MTTYTNPDSIPVTETTDLIASSADDLRTRLNQIATAAQQGINRVDGEAAQGDTDTLQAAKTYSDNAVGGATWKKGTQPGGTDLNNITTPGLYDFTSTSTITNTPLNITGFLEVFNVGSVPLQYFTTNEAKPRKYVRRFAGGVWAAWAPDVWQVGSVSSTTDLNTLTNPGFYEITSTSNILNAPDKVTGTLEVMKVGGNATQRFTTMEEKPRVYTRRFSSGSWQAWSPISWGGFVASTTNINNIRSAGVYSVQNSGTPGLPVAIVGSLEVLQASSHVTQRYVTLTSPPRTYQRMWDGTVWGAWDSDVATETVTSIENRLGVLEADQPLDQKPTRQLPIAPLDFTITPSAGSDIMSSMDRTRTKGWNNYTFILRETHDEGATWTEVHRFPEAMSSVRELGDGELLVIVGSGATPRTAWKSTGYPNGIAGTTWRQVLEASNPNITLSGGWGFSQYKHMLFINEYGPKSGQTWNGATIGPGENARYTYMSLDHGDTWTVVFDLNEYLTTQQGIAVPDGQHLHGVAWDPYWDRIWITFGDDTNGTLYSDDLGETWQAAHYSSAASGPHQNVHIYALPTCVLFGTDVAPNGVQRIDRAHGKKTVDGTYPIDQAYTINDLPGRTHLCQVMTRVEREGDDAPLFIGFGSESVAAPSTIVATFDGWSFTNVWEDDVDNSAGTGLRSIVAPTIRGNLIAGSNDQRYEGQWSRIAGKAPGY